MAKKIKWKTKAKARPHNIKVSKKTLHFLAQKELITPSATNKKKPIKFKTISPKTFVKKISKFKTSSPKTFVKKISKILMKTTSYKEQVKRLSTLFHRSYKNLMKRNVGLSAILGVASKSQDLMIKMAQDSIAKTLLKKNRNRNFLKLDLRNTRDPLIRQIREHGTLLSYIEAINLMGKDSKTTIKYNGKHINRNGIILDVFKIIKNNQTKYIYASDGSLYETLDDILWEKSGEIKI